MALFRDRTDAGRQLAGRLGEVSLSRPVVLGLPRGGVPVAAEVATALGADFEVFVARKIGAPGNRELGIGAVAEGLDEPFISSTAGEMGIDPEHLSALAARAQMELPDYVRRYRGYRPMPDVAGKDTVLVDDGLATGVTAEAALRGLRGLRADGPRRLVLAVPVCAPGVAGRLAAVADEVVCVHAREDLTSVGEWYDDFSAVTDADLQSLLERQAGVPHR